MELPDGIFIDNTRADVHVIEVSGLVMQGRGRFARKVRRVQGTVAVCEPCRVRLYRPEDHRILHRGGEGPLARACCRCYKCGATRIYGQTQAQADGGVF